MPLGGKLKVFQENNNEIKRYAGWNQYALLTMDPNERVSSSNWWHKLAAGASGAAGGLFGLPALAVELPISTTIILRSIADIARSEGEDLSLPDTKFQCLQVLALGGKTSGDDGFETSYFAARTALALPFPHSSVRYC